MYLSNENTRKIPKLVIKRKNGDSKNLWTFFNILA